MTHSPRPFYSLGGINVETYDARTATPPGEIDFYVARARSSGGPVLELACGTGRVSWPIARAGVPIVGIDIEPAMLQRAEANGARETQDARDHARFVGADMTDFALDLEFALAIVPFRAFLMLLTVEQQRSALLAIRRHLRPGGALIIDIFDPLYEMLTDEPSRPTREIPDFRHPRTGHTVSVKVLARSTDRMRQQFTERWRFREVAADGTVLREEDELLTLRWIFRYEMHHLLELCGFEVQDELSDFFGAPPAYGREQIWIARRANS